MHFFIISGLSGSGKSVALGTLEDHGAHCVDNLPPSLLLEYARGLMREDSPYPKQAAIGMDARSLPEVQALPEVLRQLRDMACAVTVVFLDADNDVLIRRYNDTRRRHPLAEQAPTLRDAVQQERDCLAELAEIADWRLDTSHTNIHELRAMLRKRLNLDGAPVSVLLQSFAYRRGVPSDSDFVFDSRCLPNPHWVPELRARNGTEQEVHAYLSAQTPVTEMLEGIYRFLQCWLPAFLEASRHYLNISIGCTGGQHRSVYLVEQLAQRFSDDTRLHLTVRHRDLKAEVLS